MHCLNTDVMCCRWDQAPRGEACLPSLHGAPQMMAETTHLKNCGKQKLKTGATNLCKIVSRVRQMTANCVKRGGKTTHDFKQKRAELNNGSEV